jgi:hypothetical protein
LTLASQLDAFDYKFGISAQQACSAMTFGTASDVWVIPTGFRTVPEKSHDQSVQAVPAQLGSESQMKQSRQRNNLVAETEESI